MAIGTLDNVECLQRAGTELGQGAIVVGGGRIARRCACGPWPEPATTVRDFPCLRCQPVTRYDPEFYGGVDEQIPCDGPESIGGIPYPDHGELWTEPLEATAEGGVLRPRGRLPVLGFSYERRMKILPGQAALRVDYRISNHGAAPCAPKPRWSPRAATSARYRTCRSFKISRTDSAGVHEQAASPPPPQAA